MPNAHGKFVGVDTGVDIRRGYRQLRHWVLYTMFFCGFGLSTRYLCQTYGSWTHIHLLMSIIGLEINCRRCKIYSELPNPHLVPIRLTFLLPAFADICNLTEPELTNRP